MTRPDLPTVAIIVTAHNYAKYLPYCLDSAVSQTYPDEDYEIVVVDDGSTDETPDILREYRETYPDRISTIRLEGEGLPAACNAGIEASDAELVVRLDADDYFDENLLMVEATYLADHPGVALVYPDYYTVDHTGAVMDHVRNPEVGEEVKLLDRSPLAAGAMYRRSAWEAIGGYDEDFHYQEDYDFWIRFIDEFDVHNVNLPLMYYRRHDDNMTSDVKGHLDARNEVKRSFVEDHLAETLAETEVLCLVPAMAESRFEDPARREAPLALREVGGRPLVDYTVREALESDRVDRVQVSTEHEGIAERVRELGAEVPFLRPAELSEPTVTLESVLNDHISRLRDGEGYDPDLVVLNQYVSPLKTADHVDAAVDTWLMFSVDSVISVTETSDFLWQPGEYGLSPLFEERLLREERETLYRENGALYVFSPDTVETHEDLVGEKIGHLTLHRQNAVHIDTRYDFELTKYHLESDESVLYPDYRASSLRREAGE